MKTNETGHFKQFLKDLKEETGTADIASVDNKVDMIKRPKHLNKGKICKIHHVKNCEECLEEWYDDE